MGNQPKESFGHHSNESLGYGSINWYDHSVDGENQSVHEEDFEHFKEKLGEQEWRLQLIHSFSDGTCVKHSISRMRYNCY